MRYILTILTFLLFLTFSCNDDDVIVEDDMMVEEMIDESLIETFIWERLTDSVSTIANLESYFVQYPILNNNTVIYSNSKLKGFLAVDAETGVETWNNYGEFENELDLLRNEPIVVNDIFYFIDESRKNLEAVNAIDGSRFFKYETLTDANIVSSPTLFENSIYFATEYSYGSYNIVEWASFPVSGSSYFEPVFLFEDEVNFTTDSKPLFHKNDLGETLLIYSSSSASNYVNAYNLDKGSIEWRFEGQSSSGSTFMINDDSYVYFARGLDLYCLDANSGNVVWEKDNAFLNDLSSGLYEQGNTLIALGTEAYAYNKLDGNILWEHFSFESEDFGSNPILADDKEATIYQDHIYFYRKRVHSLLMKMEISSGQIDYFKIEDSREVEGLDTPLGVLDFEFSDLKISEDGIIYTNDQYRLFAFEAP